MKLKVMLEPSEEGGFTAYIPTLPGCISEGDTVDEAMVNIREAVELYLEPIEDNLVGAEGTVIQGLIVDLLRRFHRSTSRSPRGRNSESKPTCQLTI